MISRKNSVKWILNYLRRSHAYGSGPRGSHGWARVRGLLLKRRPWRSSRLHFGLKRQNVLLRASWCSNIFPSSTSADSDPGLQNPEIRLSDVFSFSRPFTTRHKMTKNFVNADVIKLNPHFCSNSGQGQQFHSSLNFSSKTQIFSLKFFVKWPLDRKWSQLSV